MTYSRKVKGGILLVLIECLLIGCSNVSSGSNEVSNNESSNQESSMASSNPEKNEFKVYDVFEDPDILTPKHEDYFSSVYIEDVSSINLKSDGDLWAQCWGKDGNIYAANGDGAGFGTIWQDIALNKIMGDPYEKNMRGQYINAKNLSKVWTPDQGYGTHNRKPTSMISVDGVLYLAVQDLNNSNGANLFNEAPAATIIKSIDYGKTWTFDNSKPMFSNHVFTTIMFLDYGQDSTWNEDGYVYAYGLDNNWRDSFSGCVDDPRDLYLARVPKEHIMDVSKWEYYTGDLNGNPNWSKPGDINAKRPVLSDYRRVYNDVISGGNNNYTVLGQGSVVYNKALNCYIYSSWTEYTYEFYVSKTPWGEWKHFYSKDFGRYKWDNSLYGGYATVIPSKFISKDGLTMYICSCTFAGGVKYYNYSLRKIVLGIPKNGEPTNIKSNNNLANYSYSDHPVATYRASSAGINKNINDLNYQQSNSSYTGSKKKKSNDYWGITFNSNININELVYTVGEIDFEQGGWFNKMKVQVRQNGVWCDVKNLNVSDEYTYNGTLKSFSKITIRFNQTWGNGIRIIGEPGGASCYTTIAELEVYYR